MPSFKDLKRKLYNLLPRQRYKHSLSVEKTAQSLARHYKVSKERVRIAALLHDCSRGMDRTALLKKAKRLKLKIDPIEEMEPKLLHSKISAYIARGSFGIKDKQILSAIKNHTVGVPSMSILDKIIYLSDKIEEKRTFGLPTLNNRLLKKTVQRMC